MVGNPRRHSHQLRWRIRRVRADVIGQKAEFTQDKGCKWPGRFCANPISWARDMVGLYARSSRTKDPGQGYSLARILFDFDY